MDAVFPPIVPARTACWGAESGLSAMAVAEIECSGRGSAEASAGTIGSPEMLETRAVELVPEAANAEAAADHPSARQTRDGHICSRYCTHWENSDEENGKRSAY